MPDGARAAATGVTRDHAPANVTRRRLSRWVGAAGAVGLAAAAALHVVWLVSPWPLADWAAWSRAFGSQEFRVSAPVMATVAALFAVGAYVLGARARLLPRLGPAWVYVLGTWTLAAVFGTRALLGFVEMSRTLGDPRTPEPFRDTIQLYLWIYLPIFLLLGACAGFVAVADPADPPTPTERA
jgi:hypothetical protein